MLFKTKLLSADLETGLFSSLNQKNVFDSHMSDVLYHSGHMSQLSVNNVFAVNSQRMKNV